MKLFLKQSSKLLLIFCLWILASNAYSGLLSDFTTKIQNDCENVNRLLIKKTLIELIKNKDACKQKYSILLFKKCKNINCEKLTEIYQLTKDINSGGVIGR